MISKAHSETKMVSTYRPHMKIIGDILSTTRDDLNSVEGASVTYLIRKANVSHTRISKILNNLVSQGLLEQVDSQGTFRYKISSNGREFLVAYQTFSRFAENFGLVI
jgi:predicted transcriptional regulator